MSILFFSSSLTHSFSIIFVLKIEEFLQKYKRLYLQLRHNFFIMHYSWCLLLPFILLLFFHFFLISFFSCFFPEQLKQQFMTIIIHYMNFFPHLLLFPLRVYNSMYKYTCMPCLLLNFARANMSSMTNLISSSTTTLKIKIVKWRLDWIIYINALLTDHT